MITAEKIALLSMRTQESETYSEARDAIAVDWPRCLSAAGLLAVPVPNLAAQAFSLCDRVRPDLIVMTGGDIAQADPQSPAPQSSSVFRRDQTETRLMDWALANRVPVLGVCRGMQFLNVYFGGRVLLAGSKDHEPQVGHVAARHDIEIQNPRWRKAACGQGRISVNSYHDDCVIADQLADGLSVAALSSGGVIVEAFSHVDFPVVGIQWHPERESSMSTLDSWLFRSLSSSDIATQI